MVAVNIDFQYCLTMTCGRTSL